MMYPFLSVSKMNGNEDRSNASNRAEVRAGDDESTSSTFIIMIFTPFSC